MSNLIQPRRFARVFQMDPVLHGSLAQQQAIRDALTKPWGSKQDAMLFEFDKYYNALYRRSFVTIEVKDFQGNGFGIGGTVSFSLSVLLHVSAIGDVAVHEFGHNVDATNFLSDADRLWFMEQFHPQGSRVWPDYKEMWAEAFRQWWQGISWESLDTIMLRERP